MNEYERLITPKNARQMKIIFFWESVANKLLDAVIRSGVTQQNYEESIQMFSKIFPDILNDGDDSSDLVRWRVGFESKATSLLECGEEDSISQFFNEMTASVYNKYAKVSHAIFVAMNNGGSVPKSELRALYEVGL